MIGNCTKCHLEKELAKGKRICKDCKNKYENLRRHRQNEEKKEEVNRKERERYAKKKENVEQVILDENKEMKCTGCNTTKSLDKFYAAKSKGTIRAMCKDCSLAKKKEYVKKTTQYKVDKMKTNPQFKLEVRMRTRIYHAFKSQGKSKVKRTIQYLDCTKEFFQEWIKFLLNKQKEKIMTLENYGSVWHIDHCTPCASFDLSKDEDVEKCFCWRNLRPLLADENIIKSDKINKKDIKKQEKYTKEFLSIKNDVMGQKNNLPEVKGTTSE